MARSDFIKHVPCPGCGSSDAGSLYSDGSMFCHKCGHKSRGAGTVPNDSLPPNPRRKLSKLITDANPMPLTKRGLTEESCSKWGYKVGTYNNQPVQVANYHSPDGQLVAQKVRFPNKDFRVLGDLSQAGLYGQHLWRDGGKAVIITEGEIDAISVSQVQNHKWPVVSIPSGANGATKALLAQLEWLEKFESVVLMFDQDEPGRKAALECSEILSPGKCKIATLPLKDANEMLKAGRGEEIVKAFWDAKVQRPDGIVPGTELWETIEADENTDHIPYPFEGMNPLLLGARRGEIITVCAGSGVGKSEFVAHIAYDFLVNHNETIGYVALEEPARHTGLRMMGMYLQKRLTLDRNVATEAERKTAFQKTIGNGNFYLYDHFGSTDSSNLFAKIRYMVRGCGCTTVILDHISIVVSGMEDGDERRLIDNMMTKLASMVQELQCRLILVSHLRKADGRSHEEGGRVTLDDLRGSASIKQLSFDIIGLERNQQNENTSLYTHIRVLKCRRTGRTGSAGWLRWDDPKGLLIPSDPPSEAIEAFGSNESDDY